MILRVPRIRRAFIATAGLGLLVVLTACGSGTQDDPSERTWQLTQLEGSSLVEATTIDFTITDGTVAGTAGCNSYSGAATFDASTGDMTLGPDIISTMMACDQPIMDQEQKYLAALMRVTSYQMARDELLLEDSDGVVVAQFD